MRAAAAEFFNTPSQGRFTHFIIWNEAANPVYFDLTCAAPLAELPHAAADAAILMTRSEAGLLPGCSRLEGCSSPGATTSRC